MTRPLGPVTARVAASLAAFLGGMLLGSSSDLDIARLYPPSLWRMNIFEDVPFEPRYSTRDYVFLATCALFAGVGVRFAPTVARALVERSRRERPPWSTGMGVATGQILFVLAVLLAASSSLGISLSNDRARLPDALAVLRAIGTFAFVFGLLVARQRWLPGTRVSPGGGVGVLMAVAGFLGLIAGGVVISKIEQR